MSFGSSYVRSPTILVVAKIMTLKLITWMSVSV